jgi:hypothetical protein
VLHEDTEKSLLMRSILNNLGVNVENRKAGMQSVMESNFVFWSNLEAAAQGTNKVSFDTMKDESHQLMMHFETLCT